MRRLDVYEDRLWIGCGTAKPVGLLHVLTVFFSSFSPTRTFGSKCHTVVVDNALLAICGADRTSR